MNKKELMEKIIEQVANEATTFEEASQMIKEMVWPAIEKMMEAEMDNHLWYKKHAKEGYNTGNSRNWKYKKKVLSTSGEMKVNVPRDRNWEYAPEVIPKYETRTGEVEQKIINMYGLWLTTRDIKENVKDIYGADVSASLISDITDKIIPEIKEWQSRPLERCYPIVYLDATHYKVKENGKYENKAVYVILGIWVSGRKDILWLYIWAAESASFWQKACNDLSNRWVEDILIASIDGLSWFSEAIKKVFPQVEIQRCIIHQIRYTMGYVNYKDSKEFMKDLKAIYRANTLEEAEENLIFLEEKWGKKYKISVDSWKNNWWELSTYFVYPKSIRKLIYTTNTIEWYNRQLRKYTKNRNVFPSETSLMKLLYLVTQRVVKKWHMQVPNWWEMLWQFDSFFPGKIEKYIR